GQLDALGRALVEIYEVYVEFAFGVEVSPREQAATAGDRHLGAAAAGQFAQRAREQRLDRAGRGVVESVDAAFADPVETRLHLRKESVAGPALFVSGVRLAEKQEVAAGLHVPARRRRV